LGRFEKIPMCAAVEPGNAAAEKRHPQITCREVVTIDIGDFEFTARRRFNSFEMATTRSS
jgi:hypothetical protein